jgi:hypothetical protein
MSQSTLPAQKEGIYLEVQEPEDGETYYSHVGLGVGGVFIGAICSVFVLPGLLFWMFSGKENLTVIKQSFEGEEEYHKL